MSNDAKIKDLLKAVEDKKKKLGKKPRAVLETNGMFKYPDGGHFNINATSDPRKLVCALAVLLVRENHFHEAAKRLGAEGAEHIHDGYPVSAWETDFRNRVATIGYDKRKKELAGLTTQLNSLISSDGKTQLELDKISALLK